MAKVRVRTVGVRVMARRVLKRGSVVLGLTVAGLMMVGLARWPGFPGEVAAASTPATTASTADAVLTVDFKQCSNNNTTLGDCNWINSILQQNNSVYYEGMSTLQRLILDQITPAQGDVHTLQFHVDATKGGHHAYDFITSWDAAIAATNQLSPGTPLFPNLVSRDAATNDLACGDSIDSLVGQLCRDLRDSTNTNVAQAVMPTNLPKTPSAGNTTGNTIPSNITAYQARYSNNYGMRLYGNQPISNVTLTFNGYSAGATDQQGFYTLQWTSASTSLLIEFGAHIAVSNSGIPGYGYGTGLGASFISGGPYSATLDLLDGGSIGNWVNRLKGSDILIPPLLPNVVTTLHNQFDAPIPNFSSVPEGTIVHDSVSVDTGSSLSLIPAGSTVVFHRYETFDCTGLSTDETFAIASGAQSATVDGSSRFEPTTGSYSYNANFNSGDTGVVPDGVSTCEPFRVAVPDIKAPQDPLFSVNATGNGPGRCLEADVNASNLTSGGTPLNCTANDIDIAVAKVSEYSLDGGSTFIPLAPGDRIACVAGQTIKVRTAALLQNNAQDRYDIGLWVNPVPGASALTDAGSLACLHYNLVNGVAGVANTDGDSCGDMTQGGLTTVPLDVITLSCDDPDGNGTVELSACTAWQNTSGRFCPTADAGALGFRYGTTPETKSTCNCEPLALPIDVKGILRITKVTVPAGDATQFGFTTTGTGYTAPFNLTDGQTNSSSPLSAGTYTASETVPTGWELLSRDCVLTATGATKTFTPTASGVSVALGQGEDVTCTFTNRKLASITIVKDAKPNDAQDFAFTTTGTGLSAFSLDDDADPTLPATRTYNLAPGAYSVTETATAGWALESLSCTTGGTANGSTATITLTAGASVTCTYTNAKDAKLTVIKVANPKDGTDFAFTGTGAGVSGFALDDDADATLSNSKSFTFQAGQFGTKTITESAPPSGWALTALACVAKGTPNVQTRTASVDIQPGDDVTCTFTNTKAATITVTKDAQPNDAQDFGFTVGGTGWANFSLDDDAEGTLPSTRQFTFTDFGTKTVSENATAGWTLSSFTCSKGTKGATGYSIDLVAGDAVTCTFTNQKDATITIVKDAQPDGAQSFGFTGDLGAFSLVDDGTASRQKVFTVSAADFSPRKITETALAGWALTSVSCIGGTSSTDATSATVTPSAGSSTTCTFTNTKAATVKLVKTVSGLPPSGTTAFTFEIRTGASATQDGTLVTGGSGTANAANGGSVIFAAKLDPAATYQSCETNIPVAWLTTLSTLAGAFQPPNGGANSVWCVPFGAGTSFTLTPGGQLTFTVDNTPPPPPRLRVVKVLIPAGDNGRFDLRIDGAAPNAGSINVGNGGTTGFVPVQGGITHTVSEVINNTGGQNLALVDYVTTFSGACNSSGVTPILISGSDYTCTITNTRKGRAQVTKTVAGQVPAAGQIFTFQLREGASTTADGTILETKDTDTSGNISFTTKLVPGNTYQVCEWVMPGWNTSLAGDEALFVPNSIIPPSLPNPNVNNMTVCATFTVTAGQTRTFTVDNTPPPGGRALTIGFWKNWASCAQSAQKKYNWLDWALAMASQNTTNPPGGMVVSAQNAGSGWPNYASLWYLVLKGDPTSTQTTVKNAPDCDKARNLLDKTTIDGRKKMASDPLFNMTAQLVAAEANRFAGAGISGVTITNINRAVLLDGKYQFNGNTYQGRLTAADTSLASCLATQLDNYNSNRAVSACP